MRNIIVALAAFVVLGGLAWLLMPRDLPRQSEGAGITVVAAGLGIRSTNPQVAHRRQPVVIGRAPDPVRSWIGRWDGLDGAAMDIRADPAAAGSARYAVTLPVGMDGTMQTVPAKRSAIRCSCTAPMATMRSSAAMAAVRPMPGWRRSPTA